MSFKVITYDVEHGSSHILITPNEQVIMIDAGSKGDFSPVLQLKNKHGIKQIRWFTVTHFDADHLTDINELAEHFDPWMEGVNILEQPSLTPDQFRGIYQEEFSAPLEVFLEFRKPFNRPAPPMGDPSYDWGGVQFATFNNSYDDLANPNMNDMSIVTFAHYMGWTFIFPGDLEKQGWLKLLEKEEFRNWLGRTDVFIASHHGRESGYCQEVFKYCKPILTLISDKSVTDTSCTNEYRQVTTGLNIKNPLGIDLKRYVLTTRDDGAIYIDIDAEGRYLVKTNEYY